MCHFIPLKKISVDVSGPYSESSQGNKYIVNFVDWPEAYAAPDKKTQTVAGLLLTEVILRFGTSLELVSDNGPKNVNEVMRQTMESLNIKHIVTSPYHPLANVKVERFHCFLGDTLAKLTESEKENCDLFLTQALGAIKFSINEVTGFLSYFLLFWRDVILPIDNLLKPRRKYVGEDFDQIILQNQHNISMRARQRIKRAQKKRNERVNLGRKEVTLKIGDPVYHKKYQRHGKLDKKWSPYYRVIDQTGPVTFVVWDQRNERIKRPYANDIKLVGL